MLPRRISVSLFIDQSIIWPVKRLQAFKFQLRPGGQQEREMRRPGRLTVPAADFDMLLTFKSSMTIIAWFLLTVFLTL